MKISPVLVLVLVLNLTSVFSNEVIPFEVREVTQNGTEGGVDQRIYGGSEAVKGQFPFMVFVLMKVGETLRTCSASLIKPDLVLLAAHCVHFPGFTAKDIVMAAGKTNTKTYVMQRLMMNFYEPIDEALFGLQERRGEVIHKHPKYNDTDLEHDVAMVKLEKPFVLETGNVATVSLSQERMKSQKSCTILGWGLNLGNVQTFRLNYVNNKIVSNTALGCVAKTSGPFICLKKDNSGICQGDSGSPLVCDEKVWGVASHYVTSSPDPECGNSLEEYYTELYYDLDWLQPIINSGYKSAVVSLNFLLISLFVAISSGKSKPI